MRVTVFMRSTSDAIFLDETLRLLAGRGHDVSIVADAFDDDGDGVMERLANDHPAVRCGQTPARRFNSMTFLGAELRRALEAVHESSASDVDETRARSDETGAELPGEVEGRGFVARVRGLPLAASPQGRRLLEWVLRWSERAVPGDPDLAAVVEAERPDVVLVTASGSGGTTEAEYVRAARRFGARVGLVGPPVRVTAVQRVLGGPLDVVMTAEMMAPPATPDSGLADAIESAGRQRRRSGGAPWWAVLLRPVLWRAAARVARTAEARREKAASQRRIEEQRDADRLARRAEMLSVKQQAHAESALRKGEERARVDAERQALAETAEGAYEHYRCVRSWAQRMRESVEEVALTDAELKVRRELAPLWHAAPETVATLRRWSECVSGVRVSEYEPPSDELAHQLRRELSMLWKQVGRELFLSESPILGGFGDSKKGDLYNADTLRFFKVLIALQDGAVLPVFHGDPRRLVWEVGGGWGGFARQFKTLCPNVTYLMTGSPDQFLLSAVYLMAAFPGARVRFYDPAAPDELWRDWEQVDFMFAPEGALAQLRPPRLDLLLDLLVLCHMRPERASAHVERAFASGCPYTYSLLPDGGSSDASSTAASAVSRFYWPHPIPPRREQARPGSLSHEPDPDLEREPSHLVGWKRIRL